MLPERLSTDQTSLNEGAGPGGGGDRDDGGGGWVDRGESHLPCAGTQSRAVDVRRGGAVAGGQGGDAGEGGGVGAAGGAAAIAERSGAPAARGARSHGRVDLRPRRVADRGGRRQGAQRGRAAGEYGVAADRRFHDRRQRGDGADAARGGSGVHPAHREGAGALAADGGTGGAIRRPSARGTRRGGAERVPGAAQAGRPGALRGCFAGGVEADGSGRVRGVAAGDGGGRALRPGGARLHALHGAQPALRRPGDAAPGQGASGAPARALHGRRNWTLRRATAR